MNHQNFNNTKCTNAVKIIPIREKIICSTKNAEWLCPNQKKTSFNGMWTTKLTQNTTLTKCSMLLTTGLEIFVYKSQTPRPCRIQWCKWCWQVKRSTDLNEEGIQGTCSTIKMWYLCGLHSKKYAQKYLSFSAVLDASPQNAGCWDGSSSPACQFAFSIQKGAYV